MKDYLPEGMALPQGGYTLEQLRKARQDGTILQAPALVCTENHDLLVTLGCCTGRIPREETALGISDGSVREIAILSRVGKPVSFQVLELLPDGTALLSRRLAQEAARAQIFSTRQPGDILPAVVTGLAPFGAFCDVGCGICALLGLEQISVSRIRHSRDRFQEDQPIYAVIHALDRSSMQIQLSHKELLGTWAENAALFAAGQTRIGTVRSVRDYGVFIELTPNLSGLAEPNDTLTPGDSVCVYLKSILPQSLKIKLTVLRKLDTAVLPVQPLHYFRTDGHITRWQYGTDRLPKCISVFDAIV